MHSNDELDRYMNRGLCFANEVRDLYPAVWSAAGAAIAKCNEVMHLVADGDTQRERKELSAFLGLWGAVRRYQINSLLEIFSRNLDEGLAILRMATETARTLKAVSTSADVYSIWLKGEERHSSEFKAAGRFDKSDPIQNAVYNAYNFCTDYGTHGHKTSAVFIVDTPMGKEPSMAGVASIAAAWFVHCVPMHRFCLKSLVDDSSDLFVAADLGLTVAEARLIERIQNDPFFKNINGTTAH